MNVMHNIFNYVSVIRSYNETYVNNYVCMLVLMNNKIIHFMCHIYLLSTCDWNYNRALCVSFLNRISCDFIIASGLHILNLNYMYLKNTNLHYSARKDSKFNCVIL